MTKKELLEKIESYNFNQAIPYHKLIVSEIPDEEPIKFDYYEMREYMENKLLEALMEIDDIIYES